MKFVDENLRPDIDYLVFRKCTTSWRMNEYLLERCNIIYVVKGRAQYTINGKDYETRAGDLICLNNGDIQKGITFSDNLMHCFSLYFNLRNAEDKEIPLPFPVLNHIGNQKYLEELFHELVYTWFDRRDGYKLKSEALTMLILHHIFELTADSHEFRTYDFRINKITRYIADNYMKRITVKKMADLVGLNEIYLGTLFKKETGLTVSQYLIKTRIRNAEYLLRSGECNVGEAAYLCGFSDIAHFYKNFKAITGMAPSLFIPRK
jgi:AraC-like DNA-binding protein